MSTSESSENGQIVESIHCQSYYESLSPQSSSDIDELNRQLEALKEGDGAFYKLDPTYSKDYNNEEQQPSGSNFSGFSSRSSRSNSDRSYSDSQNSGSETGSYESSDDEMVGHKNTKNHKNSRVHRTTDQTNMVSMINSHMVTAADLRRASISGRRMSQINQAQLQGQLQGVF